MTDHKVTSWIEAELKRADLAVARGRHEQAQRARATQARFDPGCGLIMIEFENGCTFSFPPSLAQGLKDAQADDLAKIEISPQGTGLHWPKLDVDLTVEGLLLGMFGSASWMRAHAARAGSVKSPQKAQAAKANGVKGGRPPRAKTATVGA
jgi:hypothetical protein